MAEAAARLRRHDMVLVAPEAWPALLQHRADLADIAILADWAPRGRPLVVRRPVCADHGAFVPLGLPLPPSMGKLRLALELPSASIRQAGPPPLLADAAASAPAAWRASIAGLVALAPGTRVFGSLAWQHLTGLPYLTAGSDLDLLWQMTHPAGVDALLHSIARIAQDAPMRIDGEVVRADGAGANWRELHEAPISAEILVKHQTGVSLTGRAAFLAAAA